MPVYFLDTTHGWGAAVELSGKQAAEEVTVQLQPCGQARARFVGPDGKPLASRKFNFEILVTPGPHFLTRNEIEQTQLAADADFLSNIDREYYANQPVTDPAGRVTLPALLPGASHRMNDFSNSNVQGKGVQTRKVFTVKPGETLDLGDVLIEKPAGS